MLASPLVPGINDGNLLKIKMDVDNGIYTYLAKYKQHPFEPPYINITFSNYPSPPNRFGAGMGLISSVGGLFFYFPGMLYFMILLIDMVT